MKHFFANWKMYLTHEQAIDLANFYTKLDLSPNLNVVVFPSTLSFLPVKDLLVNSAVKVGAQNVSWVSAGAYTGAVSATLFSEGGAQYALVGHAERRHIFGESDADVAKKLRAVVEAGITPILCVGETAEDLAADKRQYRLSKQLMVLSEIAHQIENCFIAYEPVWSIGSSQPCLSRDVLDVHNFIRQETKKYFSAVLPIVYGGSVNKDNAKDYANLDLVDGLLIGHASTNPEQVSALTSILAS